MGWKVLISSMILSFVCLVPLGMKWEIEKKITIAAAFLISIFTGAIVNGLTSVWNLGFFHILALEFFLVVITALSLLIWRFYRDPERIPPEFENTILSPADGRIIYVKKIENGEVPVSDKGGREFPLDDFVGANVFPLGGYLVGISMNFLDVHVNRAPIGGKITLVKRIKGNFLTLKRKDAVIENERVLTVVDNGHIKVGIVQIASRLVRRIVSYFPEGHEVGRGQRIGVIRFGSQVDLIIPDLPSFRIEVKAGEKVTAGVSIIAYFNE